MRLSNFILDNIEVILEEWEIFAASLQPFHESTKAALRDNAAAMLEVIAADLTKPQGDLESIAKSKGMAPHAAIDTAAESHAGERLAAGFTSEQVMAEFRALRSSVLRLWANRINFNIASSVELQDMVRFNEAVDQAQTESMTRYTKMLRDAQNLFLAILGHDVRTPLGAVSMGAQVLLMDKTLPPKAIQVGLRIFNSSKRIDAIVRDLLDFSTSHLGNGIPIDPYTVDLLEVCQNTVEEAQTFHPGRTIVLEASGNLEGIWDGQRMAQAFSNLISNAIQHGVRDSAINISICGYENEIVFKVQNEANLMAPLQLQTLFDPIKRFAIRPASERTAARMHNLGLGLYVVKEIIEAHGGTINATSAEKEGVTFAIRLPRKMPQRRSDD